MHSCGREMNSYVHAHLCVSIWTAHGLLGSVENPVTGLPTVVFPRELGIAHLFGCEQFGKVCHFKWVDGWREEARTGKRSLPSLGGVLMDVHGTPFFQLFHISKYFQTIQKKTRQKVCRSRCPPAAHVQDALQVAFLLLLSSSSCSLPPFPPPRCPPPPPQAFSCRSQN